MTAPTLPPDPAPDLAPTPPANHRHRSADRSRISGSFFLATFVMCGLVVLGVFLGIVVFDPSDDSTNTSPAHSHHSRGSRLQPAGPPNLLRIRAVPSTPTTLAAPTPNTPTHPGPQVLNLFLVPSGTATATLPPDPTTGQLDPAGLAAYNCVPVSQQAIRTLCWGTALLPYGQVTFQGSQLENAALDSPPHDSTTFIITGGTDVYARATGTLGMRVLPHTGQQDWTFRFTSTSPAAQKSLKNQSTTPATSPTTNGSSP